MPHKAALIIPEFGKSDESTDCRLPNNMKENICQGESPTPFHSIGMIDYTPQTLGMQDKNKALSVFFHFVPTRNLSISPFRSSLCAGRCHNGLSRDVFLWTKLDTTARLQTTSPALSKTVHHTGDAGTGSDLPHKEQ